MTGNLSWRDFAGVQMLSVRQSSLTGSAAAPGTDTPRCIQIGPNLSVCRTPFHTIGGCGARQRSSPTGGAANGIDLYTVTAPSRAPSIQPVSIRTGWDQTLE